jgi:gas vesicle protein
MCCLPHNVYLISLCHKFQTAGKIIFNKAHNMVSKAGVVTYNVVFHRHMSIYLAYNSLLVKECIIMANQQNGKDLLIGALVGGILGAVTALLVAPKPGRELRSDIKEQVSTVSDKAVQVASSVSEKTQEIATAVSTQTTEWVDKAKLSATHVIDGVRSLYDFKNEKSAIEEEVTSEILEDLYAIPDRSRS